MKDFYYILGVEPDCTLDDIKEAYRKLSKKLHPDLNQGDKYFENKFREIKEAWETLRDPVKRIQYDQAINKVKSHQQEPPKQRYYYSQQAHRPSSPTPTKRKGPGVGMTIVFILIALILGDYLVRTFNPPKKIINIQSNPASKVAVAKTLKHHKKKHKNKIAADSSKVDIAITYKKPIKPVYRIKQTTFENNKQTTAANIEPAVTQVKKSIPVFNAKQTISAPSKNEGLQINSSYMTYVKANPTGVVNMREFDSYGAAIVQTIPANSKVVVIAKGNTYYRVSYNNVVGYVPKWSLQNK
ncbi:DnaJ domain-containing protein [Mucilaginibacter gotjawali]|uniref:Curved DNA-binding protein CbpA n=2 Tax=Mucilaginibacter gotjawali TaxID=1550579 RepID=A0A839SGE0_9SPHI|nr:DnaJ domain-containing protein [Mucilaginibacter gotjawali]MBB3055940.1 curved DNA-binding protein CbpA [Mucilaginibacter gotjawali]BAU54766.1 Chaperone protein DnaJ [Mucilaginibacter gotjawali]